MRRLIAAVMVTMLMVGSAHASLNYEVPSTKNRLVYLLESPFKQVCGGARQTWLACKLMREGLVNKAFFYLEQQPATVTQPLHDLWKEHYHLNVDGWGSGFTSQVNERVISILQHSTPPYEEWVFPKILVLKTARALQNLGDHEARFTGDLLMSRVIVHCMYYGMECAE